MSHRGMDRGRRAHSLTACVAPGLIGLLALVVVHATRRRALPPAVQAVIDAGDQTRWMTTGDDPWDVFVCHVPADTRSTVYAGLPLRLPLDPGALATILNAKVSAYFDTLSHGAYRPQFTAAGEVTIAAADEPQACVDKALAAASDAAHGVIAIADAEHNADATRRLRQPRQLRVPRLRARRR